MWRSDRPARAHSAGCIPSSRLACRVSRCFFSNSGTQKAPCGMTTPLNELPRSRKPAHVGFRRRGCHEAASQCQEACPGGLRAGTSDDACAAPPSNRSEVCAGMRQYMKCRRPVWRHVKTGGGGLCWPVMRWLVARGVRAGDSALDGERPAILHSFHLTCVDCLLHLLEAMRPTASLLCRRFVPIQHPHPLPLQCPGPPLA